MDIKRHKKAKINGDKWTGQASIPNEMIPNGVSHYNCYGIRGEDSKNNRTYHSLFPVPGEQPDFHRIQYFQPFPLEP